MAAARPCLVRVAWVTTTPNVSGNDSCLLRFDLARLAVSVTVEAAGIGHTELCCLLNALVRFHQPTGYLQLLDGI